MQEFSTYCQQTSLHGWAYLTESNHKYWRLAWALITITSIIGAVLLVLTEIHEFQHATIITTIGSLNVPLTEVYFPAVTICQINQVRKHLFNSLNSSKKLQQLLYEQFFVGTNHELSEDDKKELQTYLNNPDYIQLSWQYYKKELNLNFDIPEREQALEMTYYSDFEPITNESNNFLGKRSVNFDRKWNKILSGGFVTRSLYHDFQSFILKGSYDDIEVFGNDPDFLPNDMTDHGECSRILPQIVFTHREDLQNKSYIYRMLLAPFKWIHPGARVGPSNGLSLVLDSEIYDYSYHLHPGQGFKVAVHHPFDFPIMKLTSIDLAPGFVHQIKVTPTLFETTPAAIHRFQPSERQCYTDTEMDLQYVPSNQSFRYGLSNCLVEAAYQRIVSGCNCTPPFHRGFQQNMPSLICQGTSLTCMKKILRQIGTFETVNDKPCLSACQDQEIKVSVSSSTFPNQLTFVTRPEFCLVFNKVAQTCSSNRGGVLSEMYPTLCRNVNLVKDSNVSSSVLCTQRSSWTWPRPQLLKSNPSLVKRVEHDLFVYARDNVMLVNVFLPDMKVTKVIKDQKMSKISFVANVGGLLGLCMGFSFVTVFELIYHSSRLFKRRQYFQCLQPLDPNNVPI